MNFITLICFSRKTFIVNILFLFICLSLGTVNAGIEDFFHKAENKSPIHKMRNIDFIYMINLDERPEKLKESMTALEVYGIYPYRFAAVNGWKLSHQAINQVGLQFNRTMTVGAMGTVYRWREGEEYISHELIQEEGTTYFSHCLSRGAIGIVLSHLSVLQDAYDAGYQTIWVMEDDIQVLSDPREISDLIEKLDRLANGWDILFTDIDIKDYFGKPVPCLATCFRPNFQIQPLEYYIQRHPISSDFSQIRARYGAHSMIIRRSGMKKLLDFIKTYKIYLPYDIDYCYPPGIKLFCCNKDIVSNKPGAISDNGVPAYEAKQKRHT